VPSHPLDRVEWEHRAAVVAGYREMWGWSHPREAIGPQPGQHSPDARAAWQAAAEALGYQPGDLREHSDGKLWAWRSAFAREMEWAPAYCGDDLAVVRAEIRRTQIEADRARRNASVAGSEEARGRLGERALVLGRWEVMAGELAGRLAEGQEAYDAWERATGPTRDRAVAADAELRRRYPGLVIEPLRGGAPDRLPEQSGSSVAASRVEAGPAAWPDLGAHVGRFGEMLSSSGRLASGWTKLPSVRLGRRGSGLLRLLPCRLSWMILMRCRFRRGSPNLRLGSGKPCVMSRCHGCRTLLVSRPRRLGSAGGRQQTERG
jgi:hypothetical protein